MFLKNKFLFSILIPALFSLAGCSKKNIAGSSSFVYGDDLAKVRPRFEYTEPKEQISEEKKPEPVTSPTTSSEKPLHVNKKLDSALDSLSKQNKAIKYINGYRIQIYVGNVRQEADAAKSYVYQVLPDLTPYVSYSQPTYRVKAGDFIYRSDAEQYLETIKAQYSSAVILSDRVEIKKSLMVNSGVIE
ncbi:SPOR domain-containing protein [Dyadobacter luteus]|uniref:SPOR domain-containing protein n=1 Tax=Dyadobacter luteus TaxID=2259619 RepID=A0A3D8Y800_9BACT|nr:SPOR domain-containing protein [Dyadobacter luteus]REA59287.1 SPOR domain-containing protein [Dyadobacter luteus]